MTPGNEQLHQSAYEAERRAAVRRYCATSPRIGFGSGGPVFRNKLRKIHEAPFAESRDPDHLNVDGWVALELAASARHIRERHQLLAEANQRFTDAAYYGAESLDLSERLGGYRAMMNIVAVEAFTPEVDRQKLIEDAYGLYGSIAEQVIAERTSSSTQAHERNGFAAELFVAMLASRAGVLTVPASWRHDQPETREDPAVVYDLMTLSPNDGTIDQKIQVKSSTQTPLKRNYDNQVHLIRVRGDLLPESSNALDASSLLVRELAGETLTESRQHIIDSAQAKLIEQLATKKQDSSLRYRLHGGWMRSNSGGGTISYGE